MKNLSKATALIVLAIAASVVSSPAQETKTTEQPAQAHLQERRGDNRADVLRSLGLTAEQMEQIRQVNTERRPVMIEAQKRLREAMRSLDAAIYADLINEAQVEAVLKDVQSAQAEVCRVRVENELAVRRVLTPDQLARFRQLRQSFDQKRKDRRERRGRDRMHLPKPHRGENGGSPQIIAPPPAGSPDF